MLQRSSEEVLRDKLWHYAPPAIGCAVSNYLGNKGIEDGMTILQVLAGGLLVGVVVYIFTVLKVELPRI